MRVKFLIFLYSLVAAVPYFSAADKVDTQVLYLNILNCINIFLLCREFRSNSIPGLSKSISNIPVVSMMLFFIWSSITIIPAVNKVESLISLSEIFTLLISLIFLIYHFQSLEKVVRNRLILILILILTSVELISVYTPYFLEIIQNGKPAFQLLSYRGVAGNVNVMSFSLLVKVPFLMYYLHEQKYNRNVLSVLLILITFAILSILQTRSAILSFALVVLMLSFLFYVLNNRRSLIKVLRSIILPILLGIFASSIQSTLTSNITAQDRVESLLEIDEDRSIGERLRFYQAAFDSFLGSPVIGIGVGNWEIEGVKYDRKNMSNYVVPYHAHNDYLEILAESGIPAFIFYFGPIFLIVFLIIKKFSKRKNMKEEDLFLIVLFCSFSMYLIDSMFNFPQARILSQMNLLLLLSISIFYIPLEFIIPSKLFKIISIISLPLIVLSLYSSIRVYDSSKDQRILLRQFNTNDFSKPPLSEIEKMQHTYPNVTPTGMPIASKKGLHFLKNNEPERSIELFEYGLPHNPYLYMTETFLGFAYEQIKDNEKGLYYSKLAFDNAPNDVIHFGNYINSLYTNNDSIAIKEAYLNIPPKYKEPLHDELYLLVISTLKNPSSSKFTLEGLNINYQTGNDRLKKGYYFSQVGQDKTFEANRNYFIAMNYFEKENYNEAIKYFLIAYELNPYELVYLENAANAHLKLGNDNEALKLLNKLINDYDAKSPKAYYLRGLILYDLEKFDEACYDFNIANNAGLFGSTAFYEKYCN